MTKPRIIAICPTTNSHGKKDVTGAFLPEAKRFVKMHGGHLLRFDNTASKKKRREEVLDLIWGNPHNGFLDHIAFFCHGYKTGIQTGHTQRTVQELAWTIAARSNPDVRVTLYCCDTARDGDRDKTDDTLPGPGGDGGFADSLRDALCREGCAGGWIDGHTVTAHTTRAPYVRRFYTDGNPDGGVGGDWVVAPRSPEWKTWTRALWGKRKPTDIRLRFPRMTIGEVHNALKRT